MVWVPAFSSDVVKVALPPAVKGAVDNTILPAEKTTDPVGIPAEIAWPLSAGTTTRTWKPISEFPRREPQPLPSP